MCEDLVSHVYVCEFEKLVSHDMCVCVCVCVCEDLGKY